MKIADVALEPIAYALRRSPRGAGSGPRARSGWLVRVRGAAGERGVGEALPLVAAGTEDRPACQRALQAGAAALRGVEAELCTLLRHIDAACAGAPAARHALEIALLDADARAAGERVADRLGARRERIAVNALLGSPIDASELASALAAGYRTLKLKLDAEPDLAALRRVRRSVGDGVALRFDPNGAWSAEQAPARLEALRELSPELVEQPLPARDIAGLARLAARSPVPLAADEALACAPARALLARGDLTPIAMLKPMVLGGLLPALELARAAERAGVACIVTTTLDGPVATAAALALAAACNAPHLAAGLAAADWVEADFPPALVPRDGALHLDPGPGLGDGLPR